MIFYLDGYFTHCSTHNSARRRGEIVNPVILTDLYQLTKDAPKPFHTGLVTPRQRMRSSNGRGEIVIDRGAPSQPSIVIESPQLLLLPCLCSQRMPVRTKQREKRKT